MPQSYVNTVATSALNRRNSRIALADDLENSASSRKLQERQGQAALTTAGASATNAAANLASVAQRGEASRTNALLEASKLRMAEKESNRNYGLAQAQMGMEYALKDRAMNMESEIQPYKIEGLKNASARDRLAVANGELEYRLNAAMNEGNIDMIPKLFALKEMAMEAEARGYASTEALTKWDVIARNSTGIADALESGRVDLARSLYNSMMQEAEDQGLDLSGIPVFNQPPSFDMRNDYQMMANMGIQSSDFLRQLAIKQLEGKGDMTANLLDLFEAQLKANEENRKEQDQNMQFNSFFNETIAPSIIQTLGMEPTSEGFVNAANRDARPAVERYKNLMRTTLEKFNLLRDPQKASQISNTITEQFEATEAGLSWGPEDKFILPKVSPLGVESKQLVKMSSTLQNFAAPGSVKDLLTNYADINEEYAPSISRFVRQAMAEMEVANDDVRPKIMEELLQFLTIAKYQPGLR